MDSKIISSTSDIKKTVIYGKSEESLPTKHDLVKLAYEMRFAEDAYVSTIAHNCSCEDDVIGVNHYKFDHKKKVYGGLDYFECAIISNYPLFINAFEARYGAIKEDFKEEWKQAQKVIDESTNLNYLAFFGKSERFDEVCKVSSSEINKMDNFKAYPISNALHYSTKMGVVVHKLGGKIPFKSSCGEISFRDPLSNKYINIEKMN